MNPEIPFIETPQISASLLDSPDSGSFVVNKVDLYEPNIRMPQTMAIQNTGQIDLTPKKKEAVVDESLFINDQINKKVKEIQGSVRSQTDFMNHPIETPLSQTLRYNKDELGGYRVNDARQEYRYGEAQDWGDSLKSRAMQFSGNFISTLLGSIADLPTMVAATGSFAKDVYDGVDVQTAAIDNYRSLFDNKATDALDDLNKWFQDGNETYDTEHSEQHEIMSGKLFGDIFASSGFALGGMGGMLLEDAAIGFLSGGTALAPLLAAQIATGYKAIKALHSGEQAAMTLKGAMKAGQSALDGLNAAYTASKLQKGMIGLNMYTNNLYESSVEAKQAQEQIETKLTSDFQRANGRLPDVNELVEIKKTANETGNFVFAGNMLLLAATNKFEFGDMIKRMQVGKEAFEYTEKGLVNLGVKGLDDITALNKVADVAKVAPKNKLDGILQGVKKFGDNLGVVSRSSVGEMVEEGGQFAVSHAVEDYHTLKYNAKGLESANSWADSLARGLGHTVGSNEGWMNMLAGLGGGIVMGGTRKALGLDPKMNNPDSDKVINDLTQVKLGDILQGMGTKIEEHINTVGIDGRTGRASGYYESQTNLQAKLFNWTIAALKGKNNYFELRQDQIRNAKDLEGDEFTKVFGVPYDELNKGIIHDQLDQMLAHAEEIKNMHKKVEAVYKNPYGYIKDPKPQDLQNFQLYDNYKKELVYQLSKQKNNEKLSKGLADDMTLISQNADSELMTKLATRSGLVLVNGSIDTERNFIEKKGDKEGIKSVQKELLDEQKRLAGLVDSNIASDMDKASKTKIDKLVEKAQKAVEDSSTADDHADFVEEYLGHKFDNQNIQAKPNRTDITQLLTLGTEQAKIKASTERSLNLYNLLASKKGFEKFKEMELDSMMKFVQTVAVAQENTSDPTIEDEAILTKSVMRELELTGRLNLPDDVKAGIFKQIADKIKANEARTANENRVYARFKSSIDALNTTAKIEPISDRDYKAFVDNGFKGVTRVILDNLVDKVKNKLEMSEREKAIFADSEVIAYVEEKLKSAAAPQEPPKPAEPKYDAYTDLKEGDTFKSTETKTEFKLVKLEATMATILDDTGKTIKWTIQKLHNNFATGLYSKTGETDEYTRDEVNILHMKFTHKFLLDFGLNHGGSRYSVSGENSDTHGMVTVIPSDVNKKDANGNQIKAVVFTRRGMKALIAYSKMSPEEQAAEDKKGQVKPFIYGGRERDLKDTRPISSIMNEYEVDGDTASVNLNKALKAVINSEWATESEKELARYMIMYTPMDAKMVITAGHSQYDPKNKNQIEIGVLDLNDGPIESIIVHEVLHMLTVWSIHNDPKFKASIQELYDVAKKVLPEKTYYGMVNLQEFVTEGLNSPRFMAELAKIKMPGSKPRTLWRAFVESVEKIFGFRTKDTVFDYLAERVFSDIDRVNTLNVMAQQEVGMRFNPQLLFNNVADRRLVDKTKINESLMMIRQAGRLTDDYIRANGDFVITTPIGPGKPDYTEYSYKNEKGQTIKFPKLFNKSPTQIIEVQIDKQNVGILQPISTWAFDRAGVKTPLVEMTEAEYHEVTGNSPQTYTAFMENILRHAQLENSVMAKKGPETTTRVKISSFSTEININGGALALIYDETRRPFVKDLYRGFPEMTVKGEKVKTPFIISLSEAFDPQKGWVERPVGYLTTMPEGTKVYQLVKSAVEKNMAKLKGMNARYLTVVSTTGKWEKESDLEFIISHPAELQAAGHAALMGEIKSALTAGDRETHAIPDYYIADPYKGKRQLTMITKEGILYFVSKEPVTDKPVYSTGINIVEFNKITNFDEFVALVNQKIDKKNLPPVSVRDFKVDIMDDANVDPNVLIGQLKAVTSDSIRKTTLSIQGTDPYVNEKLADTVTGIPETTQEEEDDDSFSLSDIAFDTEFENDGNTGIISDADPVAPVIETKTATGPSRANAIKKQGRGKGFSWPEQSPDRALIREYIRTCGS